MEEDFYDQLRILLFNLNTILSYNVAYTQHTAIYSDLYSTY